MNTCDKLSKVWRYIQQKLAFYERPHSKKSLFPGAYWPNLDLNENSKILFITIQIWINHVLMCEHEIESLVNFTVHVMQVY